MLANVIPGAAATTAYDFSLQNNSTAGVSFGITSQITTISGLTGSPDQSKLLLNLYENGTDPDIGANTTGWVTLTAFQAAAKAVNSTITAGNIKDYKLGVKLDSTAANEWQGQSLTFTFTVTGTQP